jgi:gliding motility-associated-like protein
MPLRPLPQLLISALLTFGSLHQAAAQAFISRWQYEWGGDRQDFLANIIPLPGNQYLFGGTSASDPNTCNKTAPSYGNDDFALFVLDDNGNKLWEQTYGGAADDELYYVAKVPSGGYVLTGETDSGPSGIKTSPSYGSGDVWLVRTDDNGNLLWEKTYGGSQYEDGQKVLPTPDGGFLVGGRSISTYAGYNNGLEDYLVMKLDGNGNLLWSKTYGGSANDELEDILPMPDGNYLLSGYSNSSAGGTKTAPLIGTSDNWIICIRPDGSQVWDKDYGTGGQDAGGTLLALIDGNYLVTAFTNSGGGLFVGGGTGVIRKIDGQGNQLWVQYCSGQGIFNMATQSTDGTIYVGGGSSGGIQGCKTSPLVGGGVSDIWITIYDASGNKIGDLDYGGNDADLITDIKVINGDVWVAGWTDSYENGNKTVQRCGETADGWIIRLTHSLYLSAPTPPNICNNTGDFQVGFTAFNVYQAGNIFTAQLSDSTGDFTTFTNIGSLTATQSGTIAATLPSNLPPGDQYRIRVIASLPADTTFANVVSIQGLPQVSLGNDTTICTNKPLTIPTGPQPSGTLFLWNDGSTGNSLTVASSGTYTCIVQNSCGAVTGTIQIAAKSPPAANIGNDTSFCQGKFITLQSSPQSPDVTYLWSNGAVTPSIVTAGGGAFWLQTTNTCGSTGDTVVVTMNPRPVSLLDKDSLLCYGTTRILDPGKGFTSYIWNDGQSGETRSVANPGKYWVQIIDSNGCITQDTAIITAVAPLPAGFLPPDTSLCSYEDLILKTTISFAAYEWSTGDAGPSIDATTPGLYWLKATDQNGCTGTDSIVIGAKECPFGFFMPSAFTPNIGGKNNLCHPLLFGRTGKFHFTIYNRWGQKVFETSDYTGGWDGNINGGPAAAGAYVWTCYYQLGDSADKFAKGTVILIR